MEDINERQGERTASSILEALEILERVLVLRLEKISSDEDPEARKEAREFVFANYFAAMREANRFAHKAAKEVWLCLTSNEDLQQNHHILLEFFREFEEVLGDDQDYMLKVPNVPLSAESYEITELTINPLAFRLAQAKLEAVLDLIKSTVQYNPVDSLAELMREFFLKQGDSKLDGRDSIDLLARTIQQLQEATLVIMARKRLTFLVTPVLERLGDVPLNLAKPSEDYLRRVDIFNALVDARLRFLLERLRNEALSESDGIY